MSSDSEYIPLHPQIGTPQSVGSLLGSFILITMNRSPSPAFINNPYTHPKALVTTVRKNYFCPFSVWDVLRAQRRVSEKEEVPRPSRPWLVAGASLFQNSEHWKVAGNLLSGWSHNQKRWESQAPGYPFDKDLNPEPLGWGVGEEEYARRAQIIIPWKARLWGKEAEISQNQRLYKLLFCARSAQHASLPFLFAGSLFCRMEY